MIIYKTTNLINGKIYIGKDVKNNSNYYGSGKILKQAIKKYGKENFKKEILVECFSKSELELEEIEQINKYSSNDPNIGYNITNGGSGGVTKKIKIYQYSKNGDFIKEWESSEVASKELNLDSSAIRKVCKGILKSCGGFIWLESKKFDVTYKTNKEKNILQYDMSGNFIKEWVSIKDAENYLKIKPYSGNIGLVLDKPNRSSHGYIWLTKCGKIKYKINEYEHNLSKKVNQLNDSYNIIKTWDSINNVCENLKIKQSTLIKYLKLDKKLGGYYWEYNK
jgi:hypothetical protein